MPGQMGPIGLAQPQHNPVLGTCSVRVRAAETLAALGRSVMSWVRRRREDAPPTLEDAGRQLVSVLVFWSSWTHRKVDAVALLEGEQARRRVSLDLTVPALPWPLGTPGASHTLAPLATVRKAVMRQFDATDANGASIPVLSARENGGLSVAFLAALIAAETGHKATDADRADIEACVFESVPVSTQRAQSLVVRLGLEQTISEAFLLRLAEEFILFAVLPAAVAGTRTVVKYSYHWSAGHPTTAGARLMDLGRRTAAGLGWSPYALEVQLGPPGAAASVHVEVQAPVGLRCVDLAVFDAAEIVVASDTEAGTVAHTHVSDERQPTRAVIRFDPDLAGLHRVVTWSAWGVALLLLATFWRLGAVALDPGTPVGLLLFGPAILLTWLVRPGENAIVSAVVGPLRAIGLGLAGALFGVAFALSIGFDGLPHRPGWGDAVVVGWVGSIVMSVLTGIVLAIGRINVRARMTEGGTRDD